MRRGPYARLHADPPLHRRHMMKDFDHRTERPVVVGDRAPRRCGGPTSARRLGPYDRRVSSYGGEDLDWCLRVWDAGLEVRYVPDAEVMHVFQQATRR